MGHPKLKKKTYSKPTHPWQKERLEEERELSTEFGLKNKEEVWKIASLLRKYAKQAKTLIALSSHQSDIKKAQLLKKLTLLGLIEETAKLEDVLTITLRDILSRRLQTVVYKNKLARSIRQARQFITHEHIVIGDRKITSPSYLVSKKEESLINFASKSSLFNQDHPERTLEKEAAMPLKEKKKTKKLLKSKISKGFEMSKTFQNKESKGKEKPKGKTQEQKKESKDRKPKEKQKYKK